MLAPVLCTVIALSFLLCANAEGNTGFPDVPKQSAYAGTICCAADCPAGEDRVNSLPTPGDREISAPGDLTLFGSDCLVLFYNLAGM